MFFYVIQSVVFFLQLPELTKTHGGSVRQRRWLLGGKLGCCKQDEWLPDCGNISLEVGRPGFRCLWHSGAIVPPPLASVSTCREALS